MNRQRRKIKSTRNLQKVQSKRVTNLKSVEEENRQLALQVNKRIRRLKKAGKISTYAESNLFKNLDSVSKNILKTSRKGKTLQVRLPKTLTAGELKKLNKYMKRFIESETSTVRGLEVARENVLKGLKQAIDTKNLKVTNEDLDDFYELLQDDDFKSYADKIGGSSAFALVLDAKEKNLDSNDFIETLNQYMTIADEELRNKAERLYNKYMVK